MGLIDFIFSPFTICIYVIFLFIFPLPFFLNYIVLSYFPSFGFEMISLVIFFWTSLVAFLLSVYSSTNKCAKYNLKDAFHKGITTGFYSVLVYLTIFFIPFFKSSFTDIGGNNMFY